MHFHVILSLISSLSLFPAPGQRDQSQQLPGHWLPHSHDPHFPSALLPSSQGPAGGGRHSPRTKEDCHPSRIHGPGLQHRRGRGWWRHLHLLYPGWGPCRPQWGAAEGGPDPLGERRPACTHTTPTPPGRAQGSWVGTWVGWSLVLFSSDSAFHLPCRSMVLTSAMPAMSRLPLLWRMQVRQSRLSLSINQKVPGLKLSVSWAKIFSELCLLSSDFSGDKGRVVVRWIQSSGTLLFLRI